jgi:cation:H+ antiporter
VARLERVGERLGLSEGLLGLVAALAADAPEVTAAVTAVAHHQQRVGAGVVIGSNVFNLAALLGLGAVVAGRIGLHRKVVVLGGAVAIWVAGVCLIVVLGVVPAVAGLVLAVVVVALYVAVLGSRGRGAGRLRLPARWIAWLGSAVSEEDLELEGAIRPRRGRWPDGVVAVVSLVAVVAASVTMEQAASLLGSRYAVPEIVTGGLVLAAVTSLPNVVAAVYMAVRGRGAATLSTALNSNTLNVVAGLLLPAAVLGLGRPSGQSLLITVWYATLTVVVLAFAYRDHGLGRGAGILIITAYVMFTFSVLASGYAISHDARLVAALGAVTVVILAAGLVVGHRAGTIDPAVRPPRSGLPAGDVSGQPPGPPPRVSGNGHRPPGGGSPAPTPQASMMYRARFVPGWSVRRLWAFGLVLSVLVAAVDTLLGHHVVLIGLLIIGPCCVLLTGRWMPTALTGLWAISLAVVLGIPDGIWGSATHLAFLAAVAVVAAANTAAAAVIGNIKPGGGTH